MRLKLRFSSEESLMGEQPIAHDEINQLGLAADGIAAIVNIMAKYSCCNQYEEEDAANNRYTSVFNVLEYLIEPVRDYLFEYPYPANKHPQKRSAKDGRE